MAEIALPTGGNKPPRRALRIIVIVLLVLIALPLLLWLGASAVIGKPPKPFALTAPPPAPDYAQPAAWLAFPGRNGQERSAPPGMTPVDEAKAPADVFFVHPTTDLDGRIWNAPFDAPDDVAKLNPPVRLGQASAFNGCCRIYAPQYRQASLPGLKEPGAVALAYSDVANAFRYYIAHENKGRPFILASHSQGTALAIELVQREILGTPLQGRMIAAYLVGGYAPQDFAKIGLPTCDAPRQTGCVMSWNTSKAGWTIPRKILLSRPGYWWQGAVREREVSPPICVNPVNWRANGTASAAENIGSLPFPKAPFPAGAALLPPLAPNLTGAACNAPMLEVQIPSDAPPGFSDKLSALLGIYHANDYGIFYGSIRQNAIDRTTAWLAQHGAPQP
ncbi:hypothetical protein DMC47_33460 [Nostoc sp. 3335mG]|nr:hypothetical protein DMC47_33460 [Nostoc sp. 3335mG]